MAANSVGTVVRKLPLRQRRGRGIGTLIAIPKNGGDRYRATEVTIKSLKGNIDVAFAWRFYSCNPA